MISSSIFVLSSLFHLKCLLFCFAVLYSHNPRLLFLSFFNPLFPFYHPAFLAPLILCWYHSLSKHTQVRGVHCLSGLCCYNLQWHADVGSWRYKCLPNSFLSWILIFFFVVHVCAFVKSMFVLTLYNFLHICLSHIHAQYETGVVLLIPQWHKTSIEEKKRNQPFLYFHASFHLLRSAYILEVVNYIKCERMLTYSPILIWVVIILFSWEQCIFTIYNQ